MNIPFGKGTPPLETSSLMHYLQETSCRLILKRLCRYLHQVNWNNKISVDDIVLVKLLNKSCPYWVLGRVLEVIKGHDDQVRSVRLKRGDGVVAHHSINHLYPLELSLTHNPHFQNNDSTQIESNVIPEILF